MSGYRIADLRVVPITDRVELDTVEEALESDTEPVRLHLQQALRLLTDRGSPDYRNSVKESISSVEAACKALDGERASISSALARLERGGQMHSALKQAFTKLYGWSSDAEGIRHALSDAPSLTFEEAKFMLVACSAFVNLLQAVNRD
jgi:hypothetical protein